MPQQLIEAADARGDGDHQPHAGGLGPRDHRVELLREVGKVEMAVVIDEHQLLPFALPFPFALGSGSAAGASAGST